MSDNNSEKRHSHCFHCFTVCIVCHLTLILLTTNSNTNSTNTTTNTTSGNTTANTINMHCLHNYTSDNQPTMDSTQLSSAQRSIHPFIHPSGNRKR